MQPKQKRIIFACLIGCIVLFASIGITIFLSQDKIDLPDSYITIREETLNQHYGYKAVGIIQGELDHIVIVVGGYEIKIDSQQVEKDATKWFNAFKNTDVDLFMYRCIDGALNLSTNIANLHHFITTKMESYIANATNVTIIGTSMGGILIRGLFATYNSTFNISTFISVDSPHKGVMWSPAVYEKYQNLLENFFEYNDLTRPAMRQMTVGYAEYDAFYSLLEANESTFEVRSILSKINKIAFSQSRNTTWTLTEKDREIHSLYHDRSSIVSLSYQMIKIKNRAFVEVVYSDFIPCHSALCFSNVTVEQNGEYQYRNTTSEYFDRCYAIQEWMPEVDPSWHHGDYNFAFISACA